MAATSSSIVSLGSILNKTADKAILERVSMAGLFRGLPFRLYGGDILDFPSEKEAKIKVSPTKGGGALVSVFVTLTRGNKVTKDFECPIWALRKVCHTPSDPDGYTAFRRNHPIYERITESGLSDLDSILPLLGGTFLIEEGEFEETRTRKGESRVFQQKCWALMAQEDKKEETPSENPSPRRGRSRK